MLFTLILKPPAHNQCICVCILCQPPDYNPLSTVLPCCYVLHCLYITKMCCIKINASFSASFFHHNISGKAVFSRSSFLRKMWRETAPLIKVPSKDRPVSKTCVSTEVSRFCSLVYQFLNFNESQVGDHFVLGLQYYELFSCFINLSKLDEELNYLSVVCQNLRNSSASH